MTHKNLPEGSFQITDGPSKFDLMSSLFDGKKVKITCRVKEQTGPIKIDPKITVVFCSIGAEDGSHDSWVGSILFWDENYEQERRKFYYSSKKRSGLVHKR